MSGKKIFKGGVIVTSMGEFQGDILIDDGKIVAIAKEIRADGDAEVFDLTGLELYPGGVDVHTHLDAPLAGTVTIDDFESGSIAAAFGGTTTLVDFALHSKGRSLLDTVNDWREKAEGKSFVDYGLHVSVCEMNENIIKEIKQLISEGVTSFKCFTTYRGVLMIDDGDLFRLLKLMKSTNGLVMVHAESGDIIDALVEQALAANNISPYYHAATRPSETEEEAINRCITLATLADAPLYIVHVSTKKGLKKIQEAQNNGLTVFAETCPHYLYLTSKVYKKEGFEAAKYVCSPPIREQEDSQYLWEGLRNGSIQVLASDHCPFSFEQKKLGESSFTKIPNGVPSLEARFILGYQGVCEGKLSKSRFVDVVSTAPAKLAGLYPRKGTILPGSDADMVILDPSAQSTIEAEKLHERSGYTPYEGIKVNGRIVSVVLRGEFVVKDGQLTGNRNYGKFLKRNTLTQ